MLKYYLGQILGNCSKSNADSDPLCLYKSNVRSLVGSVIIRSLQKESCDLYIPFFYHKIKFTNLQAEFPVVSSF